MTAEEHGQAAVDWQAQAQTLPSLERRTIREHCRDHLWRYDMSPERQRERASSMGRAVDVAARADPVPPPPPPAPPARTPERQSIPVQAQHLAAQVAALLHDRGQEQGQGQGSPLTVRLGQEEERQRGLGW